MAGERRRVFQNSADEKQRHLAQAGVTVAGKERLAIFPERDVGVHARAVIAEERLRHEGDGLVVLLARRCGRCICNTACSRPSVLSGAKRISISAWPAVATS